MAELPKNASAPGEDHAVLGDRGSVMVAASELQEPVLAVHLSGHFLILVSARTATPVFP